MKRKVPLLAALVLALSLVLAPVAKAAPGDVGSTERDPDEDPITVIEDDDVPLSTIDDLEVPLAGIGAADIIIEAYSQTNVSVTADQMLGAMETVRGGEQMRILLSKDGGQVVTTTVVIPTTALQAVVGEPYPSVAIYTDMAQLLMPNEVVASIVEQAKGETVVFTMAKQNAEQGQTLVGADIAVERIENGSIVELSIQSGSAAITRFGGAAATLSLTADSEIFAFGASYTVVQSGTEYVGLCNLTETGLGVEIPVTNAGTFVLLADAVEEEAGSQSLSVVASPLAAKISNNSGDVTGSGTQINVAYVCFATAALLSVGVAAVGVSTKRRRKS